MHAPAQLLYEGPQATALVRDAWEAEDIGTFVALYTAQHVESHEARVLLVKFGDAASLQAEMEAHAHAHPRGTAAAPSHHGAAAGGEPNEIAVAAAAVTHARWATHASLELPEPRVPVDDGGHHPAGALPLSRHDGGHPHDSYEAFPPLMACATQHIDSLLLLVLVLAIGICLLLVAMQRLVSSENCKDAARPHAWPGKVTPAKVQGKSHDV